VVSGSGAEVIKMGDGKLQKTQSKSPLQLRPDTVLRWFHHGWCNSQSYVNETLQTPQFVLVSDPFSKDSERAAQQKFSKFYPRIFPGKSIEKIRHSA
jgi:hypothetical protein